MGVGILHTLLPRLSFMLIRLSHLSIWLAVAAAGAAMFGPSVLQRRAADIAMVLLLAAFALGLVGRSLQRRLERARDAGPAALRLDAGALGDACVAVERVAAEASSLDAALHQVGELLRGELGARMMRASRVTASEGGATLAEILSVEPLVRARPRPVALDDSMPGRALSEGRVICDLPAAIVVPVFAGTRPVALLELLGIGIEVDDGALRGLVEASARALASHADGPASSPPLLQRMGLALVPVMARLAPHARVSGGARC